MKNCKLKSTKAVKIYKMFSNLLKYVFTMFVLFMFSLFIYGTYATKLFNRILTMSDYNEDTCDGCMRYYYGVIYVSAYVCECLIYMMLYFLAHVGAIIMMRLSLFILYTISYVTNTVEYYIDIKNKYNLYEQIDISLILQRREIINLVRTIVLVKIILALNV